MRCLIMLAALSSLCSSALAGDLTPDLIRTMLAKQGPTAVVQALDHGEAPDNAWSTMLDHVEAGDPDWLDLIPLLAPGADAGAAESMIITLSRALKTNAPAVLGLVAAGEFTVANICIDNDIEVSIGDEIAFLDTIGVTVAAVLDPGLRDVRNACLHQIGAVRISALVDGW